MKGMPTVAEKLRTAREAQNLTIQVVAEKTKIRTDHLRAIEAGDYNVFAAPIYIRGTVKIYATILKLDTDRLLIELDGELNHSAKFSEPPPLNPAGGKSVVDHLTYFLAKLNWKMGVVGLIAAVVCVVVGLVAWGVHHQKTHNPLANLPPAVYQASHSGETLPLPAHR
jgi:cytoskeletal protein RodZ